MRELISSLPFENLIYLGDTAHLPYGDKSKEALFQYCLENSSFLLKKNIKLLVVACHTASALILDDLQKRLPIPVIGVAKCGIDPLLEATQTNHVAILGTLGTISSQVHANQLLKKRPSIQIYPVACPLFVPLVEEGLIDHPAAQLIAEHYLSFLKSHPVDAALLACTHYPLLKKVIQKSLGSQIALIEPALKCAEVVKELLFSQELLHPPSKKAQYEFYATDFPEKFQKHATLFFGSEIGKVKMKVLS